MGTVGEGRVCCSSLIRQVGHLQQIGEDLDGLPNAETFRLGQRPRVGVRDHPLEQRPRRIVSAARHLGHDRVQGGRAVEEPIPSLETVLRHRQLTLDAALQTAAGDVQRAAAHALTRQPPGAGRRRQQRVAEKVRALPLTSAQRLG